MGTTTADNELCELYMYFEWVFAAYLRPDKFEDINLFVKGSELEYKTTFVRVRFLDLSTNDLSGLIPPELFHLFALQSLNLSHNHLKGVIPSNIGQMRFLESLDLSSNQFSSEIPQMSNLSFLLSDNNFKRRIPLGTQVQSFGAFSYIGNPELCGAPLPKNCVEEDKPNGLKWMEDRDSDFRSWFNNGMIFGEFLVPFASLGDGDMLIFRSLITLLSLLSSR